MKDEEIKGSIGCWVCNESNSKCLDFYLKETWRLAANNDTSKCIVLCDNCNKKILQHKRTFVLKNWGFEDWIVNKEFCGKLLGVKKSKKCSFHYHKLKDEVFYIQKGKILLRYSDDDNIEEAKTMLLFQGDHFNVPIGLRHQFEAIEDSLIIEFSTHHDDSDSHRIVCGD